MTKQERIGNGLHLVLSPYIFSFGEGGGILNKAFRSTIAWFKSAPETRWLAMGATVQRNVRNRSIIRRFGHSQKRGKRQKKNKKKPNSNLKFLKPFALKGLIRLCTRSFIKSWGARFATYNTGSSWNMLMINPPPHTPGPREWMLALTVLIENFLSWMTSVPASVLARSLRNRPSSDFTFSPAAARLI